LHPPAGGWKGLPWQFVLGLALAALGGCLVTLYKPAPGAAPAAKPQVARAAPAFGEDAAGQSL
ncbi:MAG: hypothetical protein ACREIC_30610, partial [Limisphaerales bacterium]